MDWFNRLPRWMVWGLALPLLTLNGWVALQIFAYFRTQFTIFLTATLLSFVLNYPVQWLSRFRLRRSLAILLVLLITVSVLGVLGVILAPPLVEQLNELSGRLPSWIDSSTSQVTAFQNWAVSLNLPIDLSRLSTQLQTRITTQVQTISASILGLLPDAISSVVDLGLTVVLTFYLLLHGERLWDGLYQWLPDSWNARARPLIKQNFQNYFLGQFTVAMLMGTAMTIAFVVIQVPFGLLFGIAVGVMAIFPFGPALSITIISFLTALKSIWLGVRVVTVAAVIDQVVENAIAPQLIGGFVGLNPVWILVSLLLGTKIAGVLGLIVAVPVASSIKSIFEDQKIPPSPSKMIDKSEGQPSDSSALASA
ncbi:conserved domain protein, putative [Synechococcus sp. PCC 7335]|uniref:AI-2E family transporter n=1 Tax=Synechococcus sp. (strain ATCC 29403 / PCC 7335) TaxID=91464 RepID=UPI00017ED63A|nr:AI-2E family transporter [Synechococcus sp. PCC 7335]EDX85090.1 conserved domain protein, putative [Synechococcus sp. PCC 7335]